MKLPPHDFDHLWNDETSVEEKERLMPYMIQCQLLHIWQVKQTAIAAHKRHMKELDAWISNLLSDYHKSSNKRPEID